MKIDKQQSGRCRSKIEDTGTKIRPDNMRRKVSAIMSNGRMFKNCTAWYLMWSGGKHAYVVEWEYA